MGLFFPGSHATIITDITVVNGLKRFKVAESNFPPPGTGSSWINPPGMIPWQRIVQNVRTLDWLGNNQCRATSSGAISTCQVVSFE
jgi:hypothetical protein